MNGWTLYINIYVKLLNASGWAHEICLLYLVGILIAQNASFRYNGESCESSRAFSVTTDPGSALAYIGEQHKTWIGTENSSGWLY